MTNSKSIETNMGKDDNVDSDIASCLNLDNPVSFFLFAGAGSGKTRSLVNALQHVREKYGTTLSLRGQKVGVITYTNAACDEIRSRIKFDPLFHVSTIHSFAWDLIGGFNKDIKAWLHKKLDEDIAELQTLESKGRAGTKASITRQSQIESKRNRIARMKEIRTFSYSPTGENSQPNSLNHSEVIGLCSSFLTEKDVMQQILVNRYPFLLIDESQDTNKHLIDSFMKVEALHSAQFCLGLIGDMMQRIYSDGKENIEGEIPSRWRQPKKVLNHRCPKRIVDLINKIRSEVDSLTQEARSDANSGFAEIFVLPKDTPDKPATEAAIRRRMAKITDDVAWNVQDQCKILTLEHQMSAIRMGFQGIFMPMQSIERFRTGLLDGTLSSLRFFTHRVLPLVEAQQRSDKFSTAKFVRGSSPLLSVEVLKEADNPLNQLVLAKAAVDSLMKLWEDGEPSLGAILNNIASTGLFEIPDSLQAMVKLESASAESPEEAEKADPLSEEVAAVREMLCSPFSQIASYDSYVSNTASYDTHQGVKGLQFDRVMVLMDDSEAKGFLFSFEKFLGGEALSSTDINNETVGKDTTVNRTRRLFYVTCSRTKNSLALVTYSSNPALVRKKLIDLGWFEDSEIHLDAN